MGYGLRKVLLRLAERIWKDRRYSVTVAYAKDERDRQDPE